MNKTRSEIGKLKIYAAAAAAAKSFLGLHCCETKVITFARAEQEQCSGAYWSSRTATGV